MLGYNNLNIFEYLLTTFMANTIDSYCRLCAKTSRRIIALETEQINQITVLFQLHILGTMEDKLPKNICSQCRVYVKTLWGFFKKVHKAQNILEDIFKTMVEEKDADKRMHEALETSGVYYEEIIHVQNVDEKIDPDPDYQDKMDPDPDYQDENLAETTEVLKIECESNLVEEGSIDPAETWAEYPWSCNVCSEKCSDLEDYRNHHCFELHKRYFCADCPKAYSRLPLFQAHVAERHWERHQKHLQLQCDICHRWFSCQEEQEVHRGVDHPQAGRRAKAATPPPQESGFKCDECGKRYGTRSNFNAHLKLHTGMKEFCCDECGKSFSRKVVLLNHMKIHLDMKEFTCEHCGKGFNQRCNLDEHMALHTDRRPYVCLVCDRPFKTQRILRKHVGVHSGGKPHVCEVCGREFRLRTSLLDHARNHAEAKTHTCEYCGKSFALKKVLQVHRRIHTGEQPYSCSICNKRFTNWGNMRQHMKLHEEMKNESAY